MTRAQFVKNISMGVLGTLAIKQSFSFIKNQEKMNKAVKQKTDFTFKQAFPGLMGVDIMARSFDIEPFLVFTEFRMEQPVFGPHPHAGISVMTYMLPDSKGGFINRDSQGDFSFIEPGGMHVMQAGSGMHHDEFPKVKGLECHGFQIWINHSSEDRWVTPLSMHASAQQIPEFNNGHHRVRVIHGSFDGVHSPYKMVTDVTLLHVFLQANQSIQIPAREMAFAYGLSGAGSTSSHEIVAQTLINYDTSGDQVTIEAGPAGLEFMFGSGTPHQEPITYGGPFVMTTPEQMREAQARYARGEMGKLDVYSE